MSAFGVEDSRLSKADDRRRRSDGGVAATGAGVGAAAGSAVGGGVAARAARRGEAASVARQQQHLRHADVRTAGAASERALEQAHIERRDQLAADGPRKPFGFYDHRSDAARAARHESAVGHANRGAQESAARAAEHEQFAAHKLGQATRLRRVGGIRVARAAAKGGGGGAVIGAAAGGIAAGTARVIQNRKAKR